MTGIRKQDEHLFMHLGEPINPSPKNRIATPRQHRTPVNAAELRFMRQRIEAEPETGLRDIAINALGMLERAYVEGERLPVRYATAEQFNAAHEKINKQHAGLFQILAQTEEGERQ